MVSAVLLPNAKACFITAAGLPAIGYKLETYDAGTLVPRPTYLDSAGVGTNTNPIILDARGEAVIYWDGSYKVILKDAAGVTVWTADNFSAGPFINSVPWAVAAGVADAITAAYTPAVTALTDGLILAFRATAANATTTPTFKADGTTAHTITKNGGAALSAGDIAANLSEYIVRYNLANTRWELLNPSVGVAGTWTPTLGGTATYNSRSATYTKNGRTVTFNLIIDVLLIGTGSQTQIGTLPFPVNASGGTRGFQVCFFTGIATNVVRLDAYAAAGSSTINFSCLTVAAGSVTNAPNVFQNAAVVHISGTYETT